ncbi:hypothetical protein ACJJTC_003163 [Scirpophaga incertulas]
MVKSLIKHDEASCISDTAIGTSTVTIFLTAISKYCGDVIEITNDKLTYEGRRLYEVLLKYHITNDTTEDERPVIVVDAGQEAGYESVGLALYLIEQLVSCRENIRMLTQARWVVLPSTNPDGLEYARYNRKQWRKNLRPLEDHMSHGVDISRNFEGNWGNCPTNNNGFSSTYPGDEADSENETIFVKDVLSKYKQHIKLYISIRRDGHSIGYPYASDPEDSPSKPELEKAAGLVATKVNQKAGTVYIFANQSIYDLNRQARCGHSVDYAHRTLNIKHSYELRVFMGSQYEIISKFHTMPRSYESTLRTSYFIAIRELYNFVINGNKTNNQPKESPTFLRILL